VVHTGTAVSYRVFVRNWWKWERFEVSGAINPAVYSVLRRRLVPDPGARKTTLAHGCTEEEARAICAEYARTHKPGALSRKAEYEREGGGR